MGFLSPKIPAAPPAPNPAAPAMAAASGGTSTPTSTNAALSSLITTSAQGLQRKAATQKTSLIGGSKP